MTDTPLALDAILAAHASASPYGRTEVAGRFHASYYADDADVALVFASIPALIAALRKAQAEVERLRKPHRACEACGCDGCEYCQDEALIVRAEKAEAQVAAVLALCDQADARLGQGNSLTPTAVRAAVDGAS